jgi:N-glycosylase/DNA lyase
MAEQIGKDTVLSGVRFFDLAQTLDCGQAFRWRDGGGGKFCGIAHGRRLEIIFESGKIILKNVSEEEFEKTWREYFDFSRDYGKLREEFFATENEHLRNALNFSPGLRLLNQDAWEVLISFILSQNSNIPRIKKMVESLCENFGEEISHTGEEKFYAFPSAQTLAALSEKDLAPVRCGYRAAYVLDAARKVASGEFNPQEQKKHSSDEIFRELLKIHGVGPKVAECVLLYGFSRVERYPVDVWIKRVMAEFFPHGFPCGIKNFSGIAQQFLFHYARNML